MSWKWHLEPLGYTERCAPCGKLLRINQDAGIVTWTDGKHYHVGCLLDHLASQPKADPPGAAGIGGGCGQASGLPHWGILGGAP